MVEEWIQKGAVTVEKGMPSGIGGTFSSLSLAETFESLLRYANSVLGTQTLRFFNYRERVYEKNTEK